MRSKEELIRNGLIKKGELYTIPCDYCGVPTRKWASHILNRSLLFCDINCYNKWRAVNMQGEMALNYKGGKYMVECKTCGKEVWVWPKEKNRKFCSHGCYSIDLKKRRGAETSSWKNSDYYQKKRKSPEYKEWRSGIYKRDAYTCQCCGGEGDILNAHHIKPFNSIYNQDDSILYDTDNGITFCKNCHDLYHKKYGKQDGCPEDVVEFILSMWYHLAA